MKGFRDRVQAGHVLAEALSAKGYPDPLILALPRGGVPVGAEVAHMLGAPFDLVMVRKIGVPSQPELAAAAVVNGAHPEIVLNPEIMRMAGINQEDIDQLAGLELAEIARRRQLYFKGRPAQKIAGKTAIIVDDGIATGATMRAALLAVRRQAPARLVMAIPVAPADTLASLNETVDDVICLETPPVFRAVGAHYADFSQVTDEEVVRIVDTFAGAAEPEPPQSG